MAFGDEIKGSISHWSLRMRRVCYCVQPPPPSCMIASAHQSLSNEVFSPPLIALSLVEISDDTTRCDAKKKMQKREVTERNFALPEASTTRLMPHISFSHVEEE